ncbi:MAG TPA: nicotinate-nucleotide adenylyltransferase [Bacteroidota bacterium]|nr:nicotinate-nucleotide adenylyltransferase [Bacteroidota bacterium]
MNIGIFGGTFNPPHIGHLIVLESVREQISFDSIVLIPSAQAPNKHDSILAPASGRLEMTRLAVEGNISCAVSDIEIQRRGISYTIDTIIALEALYPQANFSLIIGVDNLLEFHTWKSPKEILTRADLIVMNRPGFPEANNEFSRHAKFVNVPQIGISGTDIRRRVKFGRSIRYLVPRSVEEYILRHRLYKD